MFEKKKQVHITIDDGPSEQYTETLAGILKAHNAQATFFVLGENMKSGPVNLRRYMTFNWPTMDINTLIIGKQARGNSAKTLNGWRKGFLTSKNITVLHMAF